MSITTNTILEKFQKKAAKKSELNEIALRKELLQIELQEMNVISQSDLLLMVDSLKRHPSHGVMNNTRGGLLGIFSVVPHKAAFNYNSPHDKKSLALQNYVGAVKAYNDALAQVCSFKEAFINDAAITGKNIECIQIDDMAVLKRLDRRLYNELTAK